MFKFYFRKASFPIPLTMNQSNAMGSVSEISRENVMLAHVAASRRSSPSYSLLSRIYKGTFKNHVRFHAC